MSHRKRWVYIDGEAIEVSDEYIQPACPFVIGEIRPYKSMVDGSIIEGRAQHRAHLKRHGVVEVGNEKLTPKPKQAPGGLKESIARQVYEKLRY